MKRLLVEAVLLVTVAGTIWAYRGDASTGLGPVAIICDSGSIVNADLSVDDPGAGVTFSLPADLSWSSSGFTPHGKGSAELHNCQIVPES